MKDKPVVVALLSAKPAVDDYLKSEAENSGVPISVIPTRDDDVNLGECDCVVLMEMRSSAAGIGRAESLFELAKEAQSQGKYIIWLVAGDDNLQERVAAELNGPKVDDLTTVAHADTTHVLDAIIAFSEKFIINRPKETAASTKPSAGSSRRRKEPVNPVIEQEQQEISEVRETLKGNAQPSLPSAFSLDDLDEPDLFDDDDELLNDSGGGKGIFTGIRETAGSVLSSLKTERAIQQRILEELPNELPNVIAVSGFSGAGVSFVAWNIAACFEKQKPRVLMEGRTTGALAGWIGRMQDTELVSREGYLEGKPAPLKWGFKVVLEASNPIMPEEISQIVKLKETVIVDCGPDFESEIFRRARMKVFVTSPNPYYLQLPKPDQDDCIWILNQWPHGSTFEPAYVEQAFNRRFDLIVDDRPRQAVVALWTRRPWILSEDVEKGINPWRKLFEREEVMQ